MIFYVIKLYMFFSKFDCAVSKNNLGFAWLATI